MDRIPLPSGSHRLRWLRRGLHAASLPLLALGCAQVEIAGTSSSATPTTHVDFQDADGGATTRAASAEEPAKPAVLSAEQPVKPVPVNLDTVLRLAEEQNAQIALARERVREAFTEQKLADAAWFPTLNAGVAYYRHEGGIQNEDGSLIRSSTGALFPGVGIDAKFDLREATFLRVNAERMLRQQEGELRKVTTETLLDAANTYIDLLTARTGEAIATELEKMQREQLGRAEKLTEVEPANRIHVEGIKGDLSGQRQAIGKLRQQGNAAAAKLAYFLGLGPGVDLVPVDARLVPLAIVDATPPASDLVAQALANGPGVRELEALLSVVESGIEKTQGFRKYLPIVELKAAEGGFGAGPDSRLDWANRFDLGIQARWNLTEFLMSNQRQQLAQSKLNQVHLTY